METLRQEYYISKKEVEFHKDMKDKLQQYPKLPKWCLKKYKPKNEVKQLQVESINSFRRRLKEYVKGFANSSKDFVIRSYQFDIKVKKFGIKVPEKIKEKQLIKTGGLV